MSKIAIIGATGNVGSRLMEEALRRGHTVSAIARDTSSLEKRDGVSAHDVDVLNADSLATVLAGHDAVFSATRFAKVSETAIVGPVKHAGVQRLLVVGGAGSLYAAPGQRVLDLPDFPDAQAGSHGGRSVSGCATPRTRCGLDLRFAVGRVRARAAHAKIPARR